MQKKLRVGLFFGGRSVEHEVSVVSALQAYENIDRDKYDVLPIYVDKSGHFFTGHKFLDLKNYKDVQGLLYSSTQIVPANKQSLSSDKTTGGFLKQGFLKKFEPIDVAFPLFHGSFGEDGCIQGVFEIYGIPYVGLDVTGSAIAMDKVMSKALFRELGFNIGKYSSFTRRDWISNSSKVLKQIQQDLKFPMFVKPATGGSSIGAGKAKDEDALQFAIEVASAYSEKIIIEEAFGDEIIEVNCSALGYKDIKASVCERPVKSEELLSFSDKYMKGGGKKSGGNAGGMETLSRIIPAPISKNLTAKIQEATIKIFKALDGCGVARTDFFVDPKSEKFWVNEVNSPPGSLAFYLWEKTGTSYEELLDQLIDMALERAEEKKKTTYVFESGLLEMMASGKVAGKKTFR
jgi:D-alanine-D-alanine ligase